MDPLTLTDLQYVHPYYVAATHGSLDDQFEDGKRRAIETLQHRINRIKAYTRADYENCFGVVSEPTETDVRQT